MFDEKHSDELRRELELLVQQKRNQAIKLGEINRNMSDIKLELRRRGEAIE